MESNVHINETVQEDADQLIHMPFRINEQPGWVMVDSGTTAMFNSNTFVIMHILELAMREANIMDERREFRELPKYNIETCVV